MSVLQRIVPGVHRVVDGLVNRYLIEDGGEVALIDAGWPRSWPRVQSALQQLGRSPADVNTIVLTHAHPDHLGAAERARRRCGARVRVHRDDAALASGQADLGAGGRALRRRGAPRRPGHPRVVATPGHTQGHVCLVLDQSGIVFTGDALVTLDVLTRRRGPRLLPDAFNGDPEGTRRSLEAIARLDAGTLLPGHGDPYQGAMAAAVAQAREVDAERNANGHPR